MGIVDYILILLRFHFLVLASVWLLNHETRKLSCTDKRYPGNKMSAYRCLDRLSPNGADALRLKPDMWDLLVLDSKKGSGSTKETMAII